MSIKNDKNALIFFVDIRGFTNWAEKGENDVFLDDFIKCWHKILAENFAGSTFNKPLGDGAMIIREIKERTTSELLKTLLLDSLKKISKTNKEFDRLCKQFAEEEGTNISLKLGWGITKGPVKKINGDYIGANINKCSRYCDIARPFGIVIDAADFQTLPVLPAALAMEFKKQTRLLKGIRDDNAVWVTREIAEQFITREDLREHPEVHVAGICFRKEAKVFSVLLGQRKKSRDLYPGLYEGCGGQLADSEFFYEGVERHFEKEYHITVKVHKEINLLYEIIENNAPKIPGIRFLCEYKSGTPSSLNHIPPTPKWFTEKEFKALPKELFIHGLKDEISKFFADYKKLFN